LALMDVKLLAPAPAGKRSCAAAANYKDHNAEKAQYADQR